MYIYKYTHVYTYINVRAHLRNYMYTYVCIYDSFIRTTQNVDASIASPDHVPAANSGSSSCGSM